MASARVLALVLLGMAAGCASDHGFEVDRAALDVDVATVAESWISPALAGEKVDSVTTWADAEGREFVVASAKDGARLVFYAARTGAIVRSVGRADGADAQFQRPNGLANAGGVLWVVERDARRVQLVDPVGGRSLGSFGADVLRFPYGLYVEVIDAAAGRYRAYVTDSYQQADGQVPADVELDRRVHEFAVTLRDGVLAGARHLRAFGATQGDGRLRVVESIAGDPAYDRILVAEEDAAGGHVLKGYDFNGGFRGELLGAGIYAYQPEGIALVACADGSGYWIGSDQHPEGQRFHVFDRASLVHVGSFRGEHARATDGLWFERGDFAGFAHGALFAQYDDRGVVAFDWSRVAGALGLPATCAVGR